MFHLHTPSLFEHLQPSPTSTSHFLNPPTKIKNQKRQPLHSHSYILFQNAHSLKKFPASPLLMTAHVRRVAIQGARARTAAFAYFYRLVV